MRISLELRVNIVSLIVANLKQEVLSIASPYCSSGSTNKSSRRRLSHTRLRHLGEVGCQIICLLLTGCDTIVVLIH
jgi:hypothetical protein